MSAALAVQLSEMSEAERWEYVVAMIKQGKGPRAGRPRKNSDIIKWSDLGFTRKQVWTMKRMADVPEETLESFYAERKREGKRVTDRGLLVAGGQIRFTKDSDFEGTQVLEFATQELQGAELILDEMDTNQRRWFLRALEVRIRQIRKNVLSENVFEEKDQLSGVSR